VTTGARRRPKLQIVTTNITPNFLHAAHLSCRPTNSIRAQKENKNMILLYTYKKTNNLEHNSKLTVSVGTALQER